MSFEPEVHETQLAIIRYLLFKPHAGFAELQKATDLTSDHFNFHINKLIELAYIEKDERRYALTAKGKEYANRLDTDENVIERHQRCQWQ